MLHFDQVQLWVTYRNVIGLSPYPKFWKAGLSPPHADSVELCF